MILFRETSAAYPIPRWFCIFLGLLIAADLIYSFAQHFHTSFGGDMGPLILLILTLKKRYLMIYAPLPAALFVWMTLSDPPAVKRNACERNALLKISEATEKIVEVEGN